MTSEKTAAAAGKVGELRHDPMAMLPFCGYHMADYWQHWLDMGERGGDNMPRVFHVNWFRKDSEGKFVWPGFGDNMHVLKWIVERCDGKGQVNETPIGYLPDPATMQIDELGLDPNDVKVLFSVDAEEWQEEVEAQTDYFQMFGEKLPEGIRAELDALKSRL